MKNFLLGFALMVSFGAFAQDELRPTPELPEFSQWRSYTFYACDNNGVEIKNILNRKYKRYDLEILVPQSTGPGHVVSLYRDRVQNQICQFGEITEYYDDLIRNLKITRSPLYIDNGHSTIEPYPGLK